MKIEKLDTRTYTCGLLELAEQGVIDWEAIARSALAYMSEDEVEDMARCDFDLDADEEDEEDEEEEEEGICDKEGTPLDEGDDVAWTDPETGEVREGTIDKINGEVLTIDFADGGEVEAFGGECKYIPLTIPEKVG